jgi:hypothetical protein
MVAGGPIRLTDEELLQTCRVSKRNQGITPEWVADLRLVPRLVGQRCLRQDSYLEPAMTLLTSVLGRLPQYNPVHLPFGYEGPQIHSHGWVERDTLEQVGKQIVGLTWRETDPDTIAVAVPQAVSGAVRLAFMEEQDYDAWRPGMPSGSGWRSALNATPYGIMKVRSIVEERFGDPDGENKPAQSDQTCTEPATVPETKPDAHVSAGAAVDAQTFTISYCGKSYQFKHRSKLLFALFARLIRRPGYQVSFDVLREKNEVWDGARVEDVTIKGAVTRLKKALTDGGMPELAAAISTGHFQGQPYVILNRGKSN